jgi:hypothetical protein
MALYQVVTERLRLSAHRLSSGSGGVAGPDAKDEQKAKNDKGEIDHIRYPLGRGQLVYTDKSDLDGVGDEAKKGNAFYAFDEAEVEQFVAIDALEEVEPSDVEGESTDPRSFGLVGEDNGTDNDVAHGVELRTAEAAQAVEEDDEDTSEDSSQEPEDDTTSGGTAKPKNSK